MLELHAESGGRMREGLDNLIIGKLFGLLVQ